LRRRWGQPPLSTSSLFTSFGSDPLPGSSPCQRIFRGAPVETGILYVNMYSS
jgi:hypothetical protein